MVGDRPRKEILEGVGIPHILLAGHRIVPCIREIGEVLPRLNDAPERIAHTKKVDLGDDRNLGISGAGRHWRKSVVNPIHKVVVIVPVKHHRPRQHLPLLQRLYHRAARPNVS
ncbi:MAG TPA: hypothetical protein VMY37_32230 [Thermoguttaceae bacterium]|nr:hypothetical protein [Thermoguttaceae bacterium]